jgi:putative transposase
MPRQARVVIPGCPHHVVQRGNNREDVFFVGDDHMEYLRLLKEQSLKFGLRIDAYCLMSNHVHLVATPRSEDSLAKAVGRTNLYYTRYMNRLHNRSGHLWQNRFFSCSLDDEHFWNAMIYIERNPVRAGMVSRAWHYTGSSAGAHISGRDTLGVLDMTTWRMRFPQGLDWRKSLSHPQDDIVESSIRKYVYRGCPLGGDSFIAKLEAQLGKRLRAATPGRPKKQQNT